MRRYDAARYSDLSPEIKQPLEAAHKHAADLQSRLRKRFDTNRSLARHLKGTSQDHDQQSHAADTATGEGGDDETFLAHAELVAALSKAGVKIDWDKVDPNSTGEPDIKALESWAKESHPEKMDEVWKKLFDGKSAKEERQALLARLNSHIDDSELGKEIADGYRQINAEIVAGMTPKSVAVMQENVSDVDYFQSQDQLSKYYARRTNRSFEEAEGVGGACLTTIVEDPTGLFEREVNSQLVLNGGTDRLLAKEVHAHEMAHVLDFDNRVQYRHSHQDGWQQPWMDEIKNGTSKLSDYAQVSPAEGWAEFGRLVLTKPWQAKLLFPGSYGYWQQQGFAE